MHEPLGSEQFSFSQLPAGQSALVWQLCGCTALVESPAPAFGVSPAVIGSTLAVSPPAAVAPIPVMLGIPPAPAAPPPRKSNSTTSSLAHAVTTNQHMSTPYPVRISPPPRHWF